MLPRDETLRKRFKRDNFIRCEADDFTVVTFLGAGCVSTVVQDLTETHTVVLNLQFLDSIEQTFGVRSSYLVDRTVILVVLKGPLPHHSSSEQVLPHLLTNNEWFCGPLCCSFWPMPHLRLVCTAIGISHLSDKVKPGNRSAATWLHLHCGPGPTPHRECT